MELNNRHSKFAGVLIAMVAVIGLGVRSASADSVAYTANSPTGNQAWPGNLGLDFNVGFPIAINALGAYDSGGNSIDSTNPITVGIFERPNSDPNFVGPGTLIVSETITGGSLVDGFRFQDLANSVILNAGYYSVVAVGFGSSNLNLNGNETLPPQNADGVTPNPVPGVTYVGTGRFDSSSSLDYPTQSDQDQGFDNSNHVFAAGDFSVVPVPLPATAGVGFSMLTGFGVLAAFRRRLSQKRRVA